MANMIQNNFVGGEISPSLFGRSDLQAYYNSCAKAENYVIAKEGSLKKRHGVETDGAVDADFASVKIVPYIYDRDEAGIVLFYREEGAIVAEIRSKDALGVEGQQAVVLEDAPEDADVKSIRCSQIGDTLYTTCKGVMNKIIRVDWENKTLSLDDYRQRTKPDPVVSVSLEKSFPSGSGNRTVTYGGYVVKDGVISDVVSKGISIPTTWTAGGYVDITVTHGQSVEDPDFDYIMIGKKSGAFFGELARFYPEDVTEPTVNFRDENHVPSDVIYTQSNTLDGVLPPVVTGAYQQRLVFANASQMKTDTKVVTMSEEAESYTVDGQITELISVTSDAVDYTDECTLVDKTIYFPEPRKYTIKWRTGESQMDYPMTFWFSQTGNLYNFYANRPAADDDPFSPTLMSTGPSFIRWITPYQKALVAFTDAGIFAIAGSTTEGFSASTIQINKLSNLSVSPNIQPLETEAGLVFVGADEKTLYTMAYELQTDSTRPINRMMLVKHLTRKAKFTSIALQQFPDQVVWCSLSDGTFCSFTFEFDEKVSAWSHHSLSNGLRVLEVIGTGSVTDDSTDHTHSDIIFAIEAQSGFRLGRFRTDWQDAAESDTNPVVAELVTLPVESTDQTIAWRKKTVKDVLVRFFESGPLKVVPFASGLAEQTLNAEKTSFTGDVKVKPMGYVSDRGELHFKSDTNTDSEVLMVVTKMEVE